MGKTPMDVINEAGIHFEALQAVFNQYPGAFKVLYALDEQAFLDVDLDKIESVLSKQTT